MNWIENLSKIENTGILIENPLVESSLFEAKLIGFPRINMFGITSNLESAVNFGLLPMEYEMSIFRKQELVSKLGLRGTIPVNAGQYLLWMKTEDFTGKFQTNNAFVNVTANEFSVMSRFSMTHEININEFDADERAAFIGLTRKLNRMGYDFDGGDMDGNNNLRMPVLSTATANYPTPLDYLGQLNKLNPNIIFNFEVPQERWLFTKLFGNKLGIVSYDEFADDMKDMDLIRLQGTISERINPALKKWLGISIEAATIENKQRGYGLYIKTGDEAENAFRLAHLDKVISRELSLRKIDAQKQPDRVYTFGDRQYIFDDLHHDDRLPYIPTVTEVGYNQPPKTIWLGTKSQYEWLHNMLARGGSIPYLEFPNINQPSEHVFQELQRILDQSDYPFSLVFVDGVGINLKPKEIDDNENPYYSERILANRTVNYLLESGKITENDWMHFPQIDLTVYRERIERNGLTGDRIILVVKNNSGQTSGIYLTQDQGDFLEDVLDNHGYIDPKRKGYGSSKYVASSRIASLNNQISRYLGNETTLVEALGHDGGNALFGSSMYKQGAMLESLEGLIAESNPAVRSLNLRYDDDPLHDGAISIIDYDKIDRNNILYEPVKVAKSAVVLQSNGVKVVVEVPESISTVLERYFLSNVSEGSISAEMSNYPLETDKQLRLNETGFAKAAFNNLLQKLNSAARECGYKVLDEGQSGRTTLRFPMYERGDDQDSHHIYQKWFPSLFTS